MARAKLGSYNAGLFDKAKDSDNSSSDYTSAWEKRPDDVDAVKDNTDVKTNSNTQGSQWEGAPYALPEEESTLPDEWANYNDPYANSLLGIDKTGDNTGNLSEADIERMTGADIESFGVRDYEAYGPINRMLRWGSSGLTKQTKDEYYAEHLTNARNEDEKLLIKEAEAMGMPMPEGDLWADNDTLYKEFKEDIVQEQGFRKFQDSDEYQQLSNLSGGIDTNNDGVIDTNDMVKPRNLSTEGYKHGEKIKQGQTITLQNGKQYRYKGRDDRLWAKSIKGSSKGYDESLSWEEIKEGDEGYWDKNKDDQRMQFDVADLNRENYEGESAKMLLGMKEYGDEQSKKSWADQGVPPEVHKYMRDNPGIGMSDAMRYWQEEGSPEAKLANEQKKAQSEAHNEYMVQNKYSTDDEMAHAQELFNNLSQGNINPDGSPMTDTDIADAQAAEAYQAQFDAEERQNFIDNDPHGRTPERVAQEEKVRKNLMGPSLTDTSNINKLPVPTITDYTFKHKVASVSDKVKNLAMNVFGRRVRNNDNSGKKKSTNDIDNPSNTNFASGNPYGNVQNVLGGVKTTTTTTQGAYQPSDQEKRIAAYRDKIASGDDYPGKKNKRDDGRTIDHIMADKAAGYALDMYGNRVEMEDGEFVMAANQ